MQPRAFSCTEQRTAQHILNMAKKESAVLFLLLLDFVISNSVFFTRVYNVSLIFLNRTNLVFYII